MWFVPSSFLLFVQDSERIEDEKRAILPIFSSLVSGEEENNHKFYFLLYISILTFLLLFKH